MIGSVILPGTTPEQWPTIRAEIRQRIAKTLGTPPAGAGAEPIQFKELQRYENFGLTHIKLSYHVVDDEWHNAVVVLPEGGEGACPAPAVICMHGTFSRTEGKYAVLDPNVTQKPDLRRGIESRLYAIELARRGYVTIATDVYAFGETLHGRTNPEAVADFHRKYPDWTLDGRRILDHQRALDVLQKLDCVSDAGFGAIGDSLGGRGVMNLTAFDERVTTAVSSTGVSPHFNNVVRYRPQPDAATVKLIDPEEPVRRVPWDYHELIALCAPRALLVLEAINDVYGPNVWPDLACFYQASEVYKLLGQPERISMVTHGDGHGTPPHIRRFAYNWLDRFLKNDGQSTFD